MNSSLGTNNLLIIIGLTPLIALTNSAINSFAIGLVVIIVFIISSIATNFFKKYLIEANNIIILIVITATVITVIDRFMQIHTPIVHSGIKFFLPLIAVNSFIYNYTNNFKRTDGILSFTLNGTKKWLKIYFILIMIGMVREIFGRGTLFNQPILTSDPAVDPVILISSPAGAFLMAGFGLVIFFKIKNKND